MIEKIRAMKFRTVLLIVALAILTPQLLIAAGETRFFDMIVRNAMSIGTTSAANSKTVLDVVSTTKASRPAPSMSTAQRDAITSPATGSLVYNTDTNKLNQYNGSGWVEVGSGSGQGGVNHITNSDAETNTDGHTLYADAAGTAPVDGTAGTSSLTLTQDTAAELRGNASFKLAKSATNEQGEGVGINFTVALADYNPPKVQTISFDYKVSSNFACNAGTAASPSDIVVYIYARDTGALIQPSPFTLDCSGKFVGQFQPLTTDDDYRLILHVATTNANAWDFYYDSVTVGPLNTARGPPVSDWVSFTGSGSFTNATYSGRWRRVGDSMEIQGLMIMTGTPGASNFTFNMPTGYTMDTAKLPDGGGSTGSEAVGAGFALDAGVRRYPVIVGVNSSTAFNFPHAETTGSSLSRIEEDSPFTWGAGDSLTFTAKVPILGWGSGTSIGQLDDGRIVAARADLSTAQSGVTDKVIPFNNETVDTHSAFNSSTGVFTVPVSGWYRIYSRALVTVLDGATNATIAVRKNSVALNQSYCSVLTAGATSSGMCNVTEVVSLVSGDTIDIYIDGDASFDIDSSSARTAVAIERISGPVTPLPHETIRLRYTTAAGQSIETGGTGETIIYGTKDYDTHSAFNASTGVFTAPMPGAYRVGAFSYLASSNQWAAGEPAYLRLYKNGSIYSYLAYYTAESSTAKPVPLWGSDTVYLNQGETLQINIANESGSTIALNSLATVNYIVIEKVGNF